MHLSTEQSAKCFCLTLTFLYSLFFYIFWGSQRHHTIYCKCVRVWQCKYVCAQLILGMTAKGTVKWEGHSWLWCNSKKEKEKNYSASCLNVSKKKKKEFVCHSWCLCRWQRHSLFHCGWQSGRETEAFGERRTHHHPSSLLFCHCQQFSLPSKLPAQSTQPANAREWDKYHKQSKTMCETLANLFFFHYCFTISFFMCLTHLTLTKPFSKPPKST